MINGMIEAAESKKGGRSVSVQLTRNGSGNPEMKEKIDAIQY